MIKQIPAEIRLLDTADVMELTGIRSYTTLLKYMDVDKTLPYRKMGRKRKFTFEDIKTFLNKQGTPQSTVNR